MWRALTLNRPTRWRTATATLVSRVAPPNYARPITTWNSVKLGQQQATSPADASASQQRLLTPVPAASWAASPLGSAAASRGFSSEAYKPDSGDGNGGFNPDDLLQPLRDKVERQMMEMTAKTPQQAGPHTVHFLS